MASFDDNTVYQGYLRKENNHYPPRCSTPLFDVCVGSRPVLTPLEDIERWQNGEDQSEYLEWKRRLSRKKSPRRFKVRGPGYGEIDYLQTCRGSLTNCSIISGYFEYHPTCNRINEETIARPAPVYQMWFPVSCPQFLNPGTMMDACHYHDHDHHHHHQHHHQYHQQYPEDPTCYGIPFQHRDAPQFYAPRNEGGTFLNVLPSHNHNCYHQGSEAQASAMGYRHDLPLHGVRYPGVPKPQFVQYNQHYALPSQGAAALPAEATMGQLYYHYPAPITGFLSYPAETPATVTTSYGYVNFHCPNNHTYNMQFPLMLANSQ